MAIDIGSKTVVFRTQQRTWRVQIETPLNGDPVITVFRQNVTTDDAGGVTKIEEAATVTRHGSAVLTDAVTTAGGKSISCAELLDVLPKLFDSWAQADAAAQPPQG